MIKKYSLFILSIVFSLSLFSCKSPKDKYLSSFFGGKEYINAVFEKYDGQLKFSFLYNKNKRDLITKGLFYKEEKGNIVPLLVFNNTLITDGKTLLYRVENNEDFVGWNIKEKTLEGYDEPFIYTFKVSKDGNTTEGPSFILNDEGKFEYNEPFYEVY